MLAIYPEVNSTAAVILYLRSNACWEFFVSVRQSTCCCWSVNSILAIAGNV